MSIGQVLAAPETGWERYDDFDSNIAYVGPNWDSFTEAESYGGSRHVTMAYNSDNKVRFNFTGAKIRVISATSYNWTDSATIVIDGTSYLLNYNTDNPIYKSVVFEKLNLGSGEHSAEIYSNNSAYSYFGIDAIDVDEAGVLKPYNPISSPVLAPGNLTATAGETKITLSWTAVDGTTGYHVKRSTTAGGPYTTIVSNESGTTYVDTAVQNGTTYYYVLTAITANGESNPSNEASATPQVTAIPLSTETKLLRVTMIDSSEREYKLTKTEIDGFVNWFTRIVGTGTTVYVLNKMTGSKDYLAFDKIISFEVISIA